MKISYRISSNSIILKVVFFIIVFSINTVFSQWQTVGTVSNLGNWPSVYVLDENTIFIAGGATGPVIWRSTNGGVNFTLLPTNGLPNSNSNRFLCCVCATGINTIYAGDGSTQGNGLVNNAKIYLTTNGGQNWITILSSGTNVYGFINGIVFSRLNPLLGVANCDPNSTTENFKMWKTINGGVNWTLFQLSAPNSSGAQNSVFLIDENFYGFGLNTASARVAITTNGGTNFSFYNLFGAGGANGFVSTVAFSNDKLNGLAGTDQTSDSISRTTNGGINWFAQNIPCTITGFSCIKWVSGTTVAYVVVSNSSASQCFKTINNGSSWINLSFPTGTTNIKHSNLFISEVKDDPSQSFVFAVNNSGNIYSLIDYPMPVRLMSFIYSITGRDVRLKWITSQEINNYGFEIYRLLQNKKQEASGEWQKIGFIKGYGTSSAPEIYDFTDYNLNSGIYKYRLNQSDFNGNFEYFSLDGNVYINNPAEFNLAQNYPNPFNPVTKIKFEVPILKSPSGIIGQNVITLKVYDILGREIETLVNGVLSPGYHEILFDANNLAGGIYFYKLSCEEYSCIKKMTVVK